MKARRVVLDELCDLAFAATGASQKVFRSRRRRWLSAAYLCVRLSLGAVKKVLANLLGTRAQNEVTYAAEG